MDEQREIEARKECTRLGIDPDALCADGGINAWMVMDQELRNGIRRRPEKPRIRIAAPFVRITWTQYALNYMDPHKSP